MGKRSNNTIFSAKTRVQRPSLALQKAALRNFFPAGRVLIRQSELVWEGDLTPSSMSRTYRVEMRYKTGKYPSVRINAPELKTRSGEPLPHVYSNGNLCLFYPKAREWHGGLLLAKTVLPWTSEWLFHYEIWLASGEWCGGGYHEEGRPKP